MTGSPATDRECDVFCRYLIGEPAADYVRDRYARAVRAMAPATDPGDAFERLLLWCARAHPLATWLTDGYARWLAPRSAVRARLIALLAILESWGPTYAVLDPIESAAAWRSVLEGVARLTAAAAMTVAAAVLFGPLHLVSALCRRGSR